MGREAILYTRNSDDGVSVCYPYPLIFKYAMNGGGYWNDRPPGFLEELVRRKTSPELQRNRHITEYAARKFVEAMQFGGCSLSEAWEVVRLHDCTRGGDARDHQIINSDDLPNRVYRDAWTRWKSNSGLPYIDMEKARQIQWSRIIFAVNEENKRREKDLYGKRPMKLNKLTWQRAIANARDADELSRVMPKLR